MNNDLWKLHSLAMAASEQTKTRDECHQECLTLGNKLLDIAVTNQAYREKLITAAKILLNYKTLQETGGRGRPAKNDYKIVFGWVLLFKQGGTMTLEQTSNASNAVFYGDEDSELLCKKTLRSRTAILTERNGCRMTFTELKELASAVSGFF